MIELQHDALVFHFPDIHPEARLRLTFQRTLRIPDDDRDYPLPPGLGLFPLRHVDDHADRVPQGWLEHGGVMLPMYQAEALWLDFDGEYVADRDATYPIAVKIATGKINAVSGELWRAGLHRRPQDYVVVPEQPWLDGYCVRKGIIRQFVAMPLGAGYTAEEQVTGQAEHGGIQVQAYPMKRDVFERRFPRVDLAVSRASRLKTSGSMACLSAPASPMGLAPGGKMRQEIYGDQFRLDDWDLEHTGRCFVHLANSMTWRAVTGEDPPATPATAAEYARHGLPWFEYYDERQAALGGSGVLARLKSVLTRGKERGDVPLPENESLDPAGSVRKLRAGLRPGQVREGAF